MDGRGREEAGWQQDPWFRALGLLPILLVTLLANDYSRRGSLDEILWFCHLANLLLGLGLLTGEALLIRPAALWTVAGIFPWAGDFVSTGIPPGWTSTLSHLGGATLGLVVLARVGGHPHAWRHGLLAYLVVQALCRRFTDPRFNVNLSQATWGDWSQVFPGYGSYWVATTLLTGFGLWVTGRATMGRRPADDRL